MTTPSWLTLSDLERPGDALLTFAFSSPIVGGWNRGAAVLYTGTIDDSADRDRAKVIISAALVGDRNRWHALRSAWRQRLNRDEIRYFRSSDCRYLRGQFFKYRDQKKYPPPTGRETADRLQADLDEIIHRCRLLGVSCIIPVPLFNQFQSDLKYAKVSSENPYYWAVQTVWMLCAEVMREFGRGNVVSFAHDDTNSFDTLKKLYKGYKQKNKRQARVMADFIPLEDRANPPIQAADVAASVTHRHAIEWIQNPNSASLSRLRETMYKITIWDEPFARRVLDNELKVQASV